MNLLKRRIGLILILALSMTSVSIFGQSTVKIDSYTFGALEARSIGPAVMSGRITSIDVVNSNKRIVYIGAANGGVWKSSDAGVRYKPIFDKYTQSIGAIAVDQRSPETVWVGTGECNVRNSVSVGTGIYKTNDSGDNWKLMGLENTERLADIIVHPQKSDIVYVAAMGQLWSSNEDRGLYKTMDGGKSWEKVLYVDENTGCADIAMDPQEPNILYAAMWEFRRLPYTFKSGGPGSGLYKSSDGGKSWKKLTIGLPTGELGRIAVAVAPTRSSRVYATVEAIQEDAGVFRSDNMGETWTRVNTVQSVISRPFYFSYLKVDPTDYNRVYKTGLNLMVSTDGAKTFQAAGGGVHSDHHAIWINADDPDHIIIGTDGGIYVTHNRSGSFLFQRNLPLSQFYRVSVDNQKPYNIYGGLQDNGSWVGPSKSPNGIENRDWQNIGGGDGFAVVPDPQDPDIVYSEWQGGNVNRFHRSTMERKDIKPQPGAGDPDFRFNWNTPIVLSPTRLNRLYTGAQFLFRSTDKGESWKKLSEDLTTNDPGKQRQEESGGLTVDNSTAENHCTIYTISESPKDDAVIWVGTDDGNLQVTEDDGLTWTNVVPHIPDLPAHTWCSSVEAGHHDRSTAFATFDGHRTGDKNVYVYKTEDLGKTWKAITNGIEGYAHIIREDLKSPNLLFVGTEFGLFISVDGGQKWARFTGKFPPVAVMDLVIHPTESDVVVSTHGRGIYIIDDISSLRQIDSELLDSKVAFLDSKPTIITLPVGFMNFPGGGEFAGSNPQEVAMITYYMKKRHMFGEMKIEIYNQSGELVKTLPGGKRRGINRVPWRMRLKPPRVAPSPVLAGGAIFGPTVPEGKYDIKLIKGKETFTTQIEIIHDPESPHSEADRTLRSNMVWKLYEMQSRLAYISETLGSAQKQANDKAKGMRKKDGLRKSLEKFADKLDTFNKSIVATKTWGIPGQVRLREKVVNLYGSISRYMGRPTATQIERIPVLEKDIDKADSTFRSLLDKDFKSINRKLEKKKLDIITVQSREEWEKSKN